MKDVNESILTGGVTKDSERRGQTGSVLTFNLAVTFKSTKNADGTWTNETDYFNCVMFSGNVDLKKGDRVKVWGCHRNNNYEKNGQKVYGHQFIVDALKVFPKKNKAQANNNSDDSLPYQEPNNPGQPLPGDTPEY